MSCGSIIRFPVGPLEAFVRDKSHRPQARRLAYEWILKVDPSAAGPPDSRHALDPAPELRRDAVALKIEEAAKVDREAR